MLVEGASVPRVDDLPNDLQLLSYLNAWELTERRFQSEVADPSRHLDLAIEDQSARAPNAASDEKQPSPERQRETTDTGDRQRDALWRRLGRKEWTFAAILGAVVGVIVIAGIVSATAGDDHPTTQEREAAIDKLVSDYRVGQPGGDVQNEGEVECLVDAAVATNGWPLTSISVYDEGDAIETVWGECVANGTG